MRLRQEDGVDTDVDSLLRIATNREEFNDVAEIESVVDIVLGDMRNALNGDIFEADDRIKGE